MPSDIWLLFGVYLEPLGCERPSRSADRDTRWLSACRGSDQPCCHKRRRSTDWRGDQNHLDHCVNRSWRCRFCYRQHRPSRSGCCQASYYPIGRSQPVCHWDCSCVTHSHSVSRYHDNRLPDGHHRGDRLPDGRHYGGRLPNSRHGNCLPGGRLPGGQSPASCLCTYWLGLERSHIDSCCCTDVMCCSFWWRQSCRHMLRESIQPC